MRGDRSSTEDAPASEATGVDVPWARRAIRIGTTTVALSHVRRSVLANADYLLDTFTTDELDSAQQHDRMSRQLTALVAVKRATCEALSSHDLALHDIEVDVADGETFVTLRGRAAEHATRIGVADTSVSLTVRDDESSAVVVAIMATPLPILPIPPPSVDPLALLSELFPAGIPHDPTDLPPPGCPTGYAERNAHPASRRTRRAELLDRVAAHATDTTEDHD